MALPTKYSIAHAVLPVVSGGHLVRPVDGTGAAIDDPTVIYSVAHPVLETDVNGIAVTDALKVISTPKIVTVSPKGTPVVLVDSTGTVLGTSFGSTATNALLREDGSFVLREDGSFILREDPVSVINTIAPTITGTRGGTLTAIPGTWTGATGGVTGLWYADGVSTGVTTLAFTDSDTTKTLEYRETALPGSITASAWDGTVTTSPTFFDDFEGYADQTRVAQFKLDGVTATALPHDTSGWRGDSSDDTDGTGSCQDYRIVGGSVKHHSFNGFYTVKDLGSPSGTFDLVLPYSGADQRYAFCFSTTTSTGHDIVLCLRNFGGTTSVSVFTNNRITADLRANFTFPAFADGDTLRVILDSVGKTIAFQLNGATVGAANYDLSGWGGPWVNFHGFATNGTDPVVGTNICNSFGYYSSIQLNSVSAAINAQSSGIPGKKQIDVTALIPVTGATGAQYKIETQAGALVQGWTTMSYAGTTGTASFLIPDFAYEGQKFRVLTRNVGGTVNIASTLTAANGYTLQQTMHLGMNDTFYEYWGGNIASRDAFAQLFQTHPSDNVTVAPVGAGSNHDKGIVPPGGTYYSYAHWEEAYNPAQSYPATSTTTDDNYMMCTLNGVMWGRTSHTPRVGTAPDPTDPNGTVSGWSRRELALGSVVGLNAAGKPTQLPADTNATIQIVIPWYWPAARFSGGNITLNCKTNPGLQWNLSGSNVTMTRSGADLAAGTFVLTITGDLSGAALKLDRSTPLTGELIFSGVPSYETGAPAADIGVPYPSLDKIADFTPFYGRRNMTASQINREWGAAQNSTTAANNVPAGGRPQWKLDVDYANQCNHKVIWVNDPDTSDSTYRVAMATYYLANLNAGINVMLERSNELWNPGKISTSDLQARATANGVSMLVQYAREFKTMMLDWETVFTGANASRLQGVQAWQSVISTATWQTALDEQNSYQHTRYISAAPYFGVDVNGKDVGSYTNSTAAVIAAVNANDQTAFNSAARLVMRSAADGQVTLMKTFYNWLPSYSVSKGLNKNAIGLVSYEAGHNLIVSPTAWDAGLGAGMGNRALDMVAAYKRSATFGADERYYVDQMATYCPHIMMLFDYCGSTVRQSAAWGHMERMGNQTDESYASMKTAALFYG